MKFKVTMKISYLTTEFLFDDSAEALDFMQIAWQHRSGKDPIEQPLMGFVEEEKDEEDN